MAVAHSHVVLELTLSSMLMRIGATGTLVRHSHSGLVNLSITDTGVLNHLTFLGIISLTLERIRQKVVNRLPLLRAHFTLQIQQVLR